MANTEPKYDMRLAVTHETSSDEAEAQITSWLKSFEDVEFVKKRSHMWDTVFVSTDGAEDALDSVMASEIGADSAPEKVKVSIIDFNNASESMGVVTEPELIVKPIGATKIEGNVDAYIDDALDMFGGSLAMPDAEPSAESIANAEAKAKSENDTDAESDDEDDASQSPLYGEMKNSASSDLQDALSEFETTGRHRRVEIDEGDVDGHESAGFADSNSNEDNESSKVDAPDEASQADVGKERQQTKFADLQRKVNEEAQRIRAEEETSDAASENADFADSSQENQNYSDFVDSRASSLNLTFDESDVPEFAESSEIDSKSDLERSDRLTFALDSIMPHSKNDVLSSDVGFDDERLSQLSPQSRLSLEMAIKQANSFLDNSRVDAAAESESVTNEELRDEIFSAISHFSDSSDESVDAYADAYAEAVSFANAIQVASDEIVAEYNAREDAWVAKQIDALREIYRQNNPDRTGEAIDALIEKNTPKYAKLEADADAVRPAAVAAVVRFLRKKNTKTSDAASELTRFSESRNVALAQLEDNFSTLQSIDASNGFEVPNKPEPREESTQSENADETEKQNNSDKVNLVPASELGLTDDKSAESDSDRDETLEKTDDAVDDDVSLSPAMSALVDDESDEDEPGDEKSDKLDGDTEGEQADKSDNGGDESEKTDDDSIFDMKLDESLKSDNNNDTGEVSDFDEEEAAELPQDFMDDDSDVEKYEKKAPSKKIIAIAAACTVGLIGAGTLFTGFVWPGFFKSDESAVSQEESMSLPSGEAGAGADEEQEPSDASGLYRMGDTIRVVTRGEIQNLTISEFTPGGGAVAENSAGDKFRITQTQLDNYADENQEQFEGRETLTDQAPSDLGDQQQDEQDEQKPGEESAPGGEPVVDEAEAEQDVGEAQ